MAPPKKLRPEIELEAVCQRIERGDSLRQIAEGYGLDIAQLRRWIEADASRSARVLVAREDSAYESDEAALAVLKDETVEIARAREIASHYRWRAKTRKPKVFGDRQEIDLNAKIDLTDEQLVARIARLTAATAEA